MKGKDQELSRRDFIILAGFSGIALTIGLPFFSTGKVKLPSVDNLPAEELMSWITLDQSGKLTILCHRSEMGQGTFQAIPQIIAEELELHPAQVNIRFAPANPEKFGPQPKEGSFSIRGWYQQLLRLGATAREMLVQAAANQWSVAKSSCYAENGQVIHRMSGRRLRYDQLIEAASKLTPPEQVSLKHRMDYKIIGKPLLRQDIPLKTNGSAVFGLDKKLPGMLYAVVVRNPRFLGKVKSFDDTAALEIPGVKHVLKVHRAVFANLCEGVAIVADSLWAALQGRKALTVLWNDEGFDHQNSEQLSEQMLQNLKKPDLSQKFELAFQESEKNIEAIYETPYQSHSCMEPLNCMADVRHNRIEIWGPIQEANWTQADLSERMGIPKENVTVHMTFLGGGFGRKAFTDYPHEAALISKAVKAPVQVIWTREDDMRLGPFRPGAVYACRGGIDKHGNISAFQTISATQWIGQAWSPAPYPTPGGATYNEGELEGLLKPYYRSIPHRSFAGVPTRSPIPVMWWRSVSASTNAFASESFMDELAHAANEDPLEFRKKHLPDARYQALIQRIETASSWTSRGKKEGWGIAIAECFGSICAHAVKISRKADGEIYIDKVIAVMDCGWYVNPDIIRAQVEGSIIMGLGAAIKHATTFEDGKAVQQNFDTYLMPRISDSPQIEVHIMENNEKAGGVGEPGLPPFAPALCNAIFDLTGKRIRQLPFDLTKI